MRPLCISKAIIRRKNDGKYLLLVSSKWEKRPDRSQKPDLPGGMVESGETTIEGCIREVYEEAGIHVDPQELSLVHAETFESQRDHASITRLIYLAEVDESTEITISWEHESYSWVSLDELLSCDIRDPYSAVFRYLQKVKVLE